MPHHPYVFVLWGDKFEEAPAAIFVTQLREAGLRVKVVGLTPKPISGSHGLALGPDLTLDEALPLAAQAICLIVPQTWSGLQSLNHDPRLQQFFEIAAKNQTRFVLGPANEVDLSQLHLFPVSVVEQIMIYPRDEDMVPFSHTLAQLLLQN